EGGERLVGRHRAHGVAQVGPESVEPGDDPHVPRMLGGEHRVAELPPGARGGGFTVETLAALVGGKHLAVEVHLLGQLAVETVSPEEESQPVAKTSPHGQALAMIAAIAPVMRSKPSV